MGIKYEWVIGLLCIVDLVAFIALSPLFAKKHSSLKGGRDNSPPAKYPTNRIVEITRPRSKVIPLRKDKDDYKDE